MPKTWNVVQWIWTMTKLFVRQRSYTQKKFFWCGDKFVQLFHMLLLNKNGCVWKWCIPQTLLFKWGKWCCVVVETCWFLQDLGGTKHGVSDEVDVNRPAPGRMFPVKTLFLEDALVPWTEIDESPSNHGWFFWADENPMGSMEVSPWDAADLGDDKAFGGAAASKSPFLQSLQSKYQVQWSARLQSAKAGGKCREVAASCLVCVCVFAWVCMFWCEKVPEMPRLNPGSSLLLTERKYVRTTGRFAAASRCVDGSTNN